MEAWEQGRWLMSGDAFLKGHGAGLPAVLQDSEGRCDCTASHYQECPNAQCVAVWCQVPG